MRKDSSSKKVIYKKPRVVAKIIPVEGYAFGANTEMSGFVAGSNNSTSRVRKGEKGGDEKYRS